MRGRIRIGADSFEVAFSTSPTGTAVDVDGEAFPVRAEGQLVHVAGKEFHVVVAKDHVLVDGEPIPFTIEELVGVGAEDGAAAAHAAKVRPPMTGKLDAVRVAVGQAVTKGQVLFVLEAMKMQNEVKSPMGGVVTAIHLKPGAAVETSQVVLEIGPAPT